MGVKCRSQKEVCKQHRSSQIHSISGDYSRGNIKTGERKEERDGAGKRKQDRLMGEMYTGEANQKEGAAQSWQSLSQGSALTTQCPLASMSMLSTMCWVLKTTDRGHMNYLKFTFFKSRKMFALQLKANKHTEPSDIRNVQLNCLLCEGTLASC